MYRQLDDSEGLRPSVSSAPPALQQLDRDIHNLVLKLAQAQDSGASQLQIHAMKTQLQMKKAERIKLQRAAHSQ